MAFSAFFLTFLRLFLFAFSAAAVLMPLSSRIAKKWGALARVYNGPQRQPKGIPLLGGAAISLALFSGIFFFKIGGAATLLICSLPVLIAGIADDFTELKATPKFFGQLASASAW